MNLAAATFLSGALMAACSGKQASLEDLVKTARNYSSQLEDVQTKDQDETPVEILTDKLKLAYKKHELSQMYKNVRQSHLSPDNVNQFLEPKGLHFYKGISANKKHLRVDFLAEIKGKGFFDQILFDNRVKGKYVVLGRALMGQYDPLVIGWQRNFGEIHIKDEDITKSAIKIVDNLNFYRYTSEVFDKIKKENPNFNIREDRIAGFLEVKMMHKEFKDLYDAPKEKAIETVRNRLLQSILIHEQGHNLSLSEEETIPILCSLRYGEVPFYEVYAAYAKGEKKFLSGFLKTAKELRKQNSSYPKIESPLDLPELTKKQIRDIAGSFYENLAEFKNR